MEKTHRSVEVKDFGQSLKQVRCKRSINRVPRVADSDVIGVGA